MQNRNFSLWLSTLLLAVGSAMVALQQSDLLTSYEAEIRNIGGVIIIIGLISLVNSSRKFIYPAISKAVVLVKGEASYVIEQAKINDLAYLFEHYRKIFGNDLIPQEEFSKWMLKNPTICQKIVCVKSYSGISDRRVAGFFDLEPLTSHAYKRLVNGVIEGFGMSSKDILSPRATPKYYYIGSVGTTTRSGNDRAATLLSVLDYVKCINSNRAITLLTNPITADGLRLCEGFGFCPVNEEKRRGVWMLELQPNAQVPRYERKVLRAIISNA